jgi:hypothetical protein
MSATEPSSSNGVHVVSVFGRAEHTSRATPFEGAEVMNVFGRSEIDLRRDWTRRTPAAAGSLRLRGHRRARAADVDADTGAISALGG